MTSSTVKVLVVDDDKAMRDACFQILSRMGFEIDLAADGRRALNLLGKESYDLVFLDLVMPDQNGIEVLKQIKNPGPGSAGHYHYRPRYHRHRS